MQSAPMDILDDEDDYDDYGRLHKGSTSSNNFDNIFGHNQAGFNKEHDDSDSASRHSATNAENNTNVENEFKILMYLEDRNEMAEDAQDSDHSYNKHKNIQIEKKLDNIFKQEVPLTNIYFDKDGKETAKKPSSSEQSSQYYAIDGGNNI